MSELPLIHVLFKARKRGGDPRPRMVLLMLWAGIMMMLMAGGKANTTSDMPPVDAGDQIVATINDEPVSASEYRLVMRRQVALVYGYFKEHQNLDDHLGYWSESSGPTGPLAKLREMTREELTRIKVYQGLAKEEKLLTDATFASFRTEFERENARRNEAKRAQQAIYGPAQYDMASYYYIRFCDLAYQLKQALAKELASKVTEAEIKKYYKANKASFGDKSPAELRPGILTALSNLEAERKLAALCKSAKMNAHEDLLKSIVPRADP